MKKIAKEVKIGDKIKIADQYCSVESVEISDIGKQGTRKVRITAIIPKGDRLTIIRPEDYPLESE